MVSLTFIIISLALDLAISLSILAFLVFFSFLFFYFLNKPHYTFIQNEKIIETEIVSAIRFLILELKTQESLFEAIKQTSKNFAAVGIFLDEIVNNVSLGKTLEQSLQEVVEICPSTHLRNIFWQLLNSLQTGADITTSLKVQLDDIIEAQKIRVEEYGRELNAFSLFYMMVAIIIPTIGFTILSAVLTFVGIPISLTLLILLWIFLSIIQYFFITMITKRRPAVEAY